MLKVEKVVFGLIQISKNPALPVSESLRHLPGQTMY
jgi:hypothetical protein